METFLFSLKKITGTALGQLFAILGLKVIAFIILEIFLLLIIGHKTELIKSIYILQFPATLFVATRGSK